MTVWKARRSWYRNLPLRYKLRVMIVLTSMVALLLAGTAFVGYELLRYRSALGRELESLGDMIGSTSTAALGFRDEQAAREILAALAQNPRIVAAMLAEPGGSPLATYLREGEPPELALTTAPPPGTQVRGTRVLVSRTVVLDGSTLGSIVILGELLEVTARIARYSFIVTGVLLVSLAVALAISLNLERLIAKPLDNLAKTANRISSTADYSLREKPSSTDEIGLLIESFNEMLEHIEDRESAWHEINEYLEQRVRERTRDLETAKQAAEAANRAKTDFLANISHEIRTPMVGVMGYTDLLLKDEMTAQQREYVEAIDRSSDALLEQIDDLLDFSRIEAGKLTLKFVEIDLEETVSEVVQMLAPRARGHGVDLRLDVDPELPARIITDQRRLRQVLVNLVGNAVKFTPAGRISIQVAPAPALDQPSSHSYRLRFTVRDTGIGIPAASLPYLFDPFTQADTSSTRRYGGTGLGLAISQRIVEKMGGSIRVESVVGEGSAFSFEVPVDAPAELAPETEAPKPASETGEAACRILVVEDNPHTRTLILQQLELMGYQSEAVNDGLEALQALKKWKFDLVLMDCQMPRLDGYDATRRLREEKSWNQNVPVIAVTAHARQDDQKKCLAAGMSDYLAKPFRYEELETVIKKWLAVPDST